MVVRKYQDKERRSVKGWRRNGIEKRREDNEGEEEEEEKKIGDR